MSTAILCGSCRWWTNLTHGRAVRCGAIDGQAYLGEQEHEPSEYGTCHGAPPQVVGKAHNVRFPITQDDDWCSLAAPREPST